MRKWSNWVLFIFLKVKTTSSTESKQFDHFLPSKRVDTCRNFQIVNLSRRDQRFWLSVYFWKWKPPRENNQKILGVIRFEIGQSELERSIFQTFWKTDSCPDFLVLELEASNFGYLLIFLFSLTAKFQQDGTTLILDIL